MPGSGQPSIMDEPDVTPLAQTHIVDGSASEPNLSNDLFDRTDTIAPASIKPTDTTKTEKVLKEEKEEVKKTEEKWQLSGGLQWESQIPTTGLEGYFHGSNNKAQPWRILVPGLYLEAVQGKNAINISFLPMFSQSVARKTFRIQDTLFRSGDSLIARNADKALYKLLGMQASIGYARNMHGNWWYGLSLDAAFWQQGLVKVDGREVNLLSQIANERSYTERYRISDEWSYFNKTQMFVEGSIQYRKNRWQAALKTGIAFTPLSKGDGPAHMFRGALNFRYMLKNR